MKALLNSVDQMSNAMSFHRERHGVLASNVANIDTPNYKPIDLEIIPEGDPNTLGSVAMARTAAGHMPSAGGTMTGQVVADGSGPTGADGNAVSLEHEMAKIDSNRVRYATNSELVSRRLALLRYTSSDGVG
jgi:flagellar basal-body rod protein FlgB